MLPFYDLSTCPLVWRLFLLLFLRRSSIDTHSNHMCSEWSASSHVRDSHSPRFIFSVLQLTMHNAWRGAEKSLKCPLIPIASRSQVLVDFSACVRWLSLRVFALLFAIVRRYFVPNSWSISGAQERYSLDFSADTCQHHVCVSLYPLRMRPLQLH